MAIRAPDGANNFQKFQWGNIGACNFGERCFLYWRTVGVSLLWINNIMLCVNRPNPKSLYWEHLIESDWKMRHFKWSSSAEQSIRYIPSRKPSQARPTFEIELSTGFRRESLGRTFLENIIAKRREGRLLRMGVLTWCKKVIFSKSGLNVLFCRHPAYLYFRFLVGTMKMALACISEGSDIMRDVA